VKSMFGLLAAFISLPAFAQSYPQPGEGDPRIQTVKYDPAQIIRLSVAPGLQTMVELAAGESIQTIGVGDSVAWQVSAGKRGDFFFVKNISASAVTNMTVITAGRVYNFELAPSGGYGEVSPYHVRLEYPGRVQTVATINMEPIFEYKITGARAIRPSSVYQENNRTIVEWDADQPLPAIFTMENGSEALVNGEMQDGRFVIAGSPTKLLFRLDKKTAYATRKPLKVASDE
jgi:type IV secretion system protein VirB9